MKSTLCFIAALLLIIAFGGFMFSAGINVTIRGLSLPWLAANFLFVLAAALFVVAGVRGLPNYSLKRTDQSLRD